MANLTSEPVLSQPNSSSRIDQHSEVWSNNPHGHRGVCKVLIRQGIDKGPQIIISYFTFLDVIITTALTAVDIARFKRWCHCLLITLQLTQHLISWMGNPGL